MSKSTVDEKLQARDFKKVTAMIERAKKSANRFKELNSQKKSYAVFFHET